MNVTWIEPAFKFKARRLSEPPELHPEVPCRVYWSDAATESAMYRPGTLASIERDHCLATMRACDYNRKRAARALGIGVRTLQLKLKAWGYPARWRG